MPNCSGSCNGKCQVPSPSRPPSRARAKQRKQIRPEMRVIKLTPNPLIYTCRSYLLLGDWNRLADVNTLIDPGTDGAVIDEIERLATGCGKRPVAQIILTHNHFDHAAGALQVKRRFGARLYAWCDGEGVDELLHDGQFLKAGDDELQVLHTPGHSSDSICLYSSRHCILFSGDTQMQIPVDDSVLSPEYAQTMRRLSFLRIDTVYSGHDPALSNCIQKSICRNFADLRVIATAPPQCAPLQVLSITNHREEENVEQQEGEEKVGD